MAHTPGSWKFVSDGEGKNRIRHIIAGLKDYSLMCDERYYPWCPDSDDDWRLIAAAPDLLAALKELRAWHKGEYQSNPDIDARVDAAIAKAEVL